MIRAKLQQELNQLRQHFQNLVLEHKEQEQQLRKEKWKNETNVEGLLNRYDDDMSKKQVNCLGYCGENKNKDIN